MKKSKKLSIWASCGGLAAIAVSVPSVATSCSQSDDTPTTDSYTVIAPDSVDVACNKISKKQSLSLKNKSGTLIKSGVTWQFDSLEKSHSKIKLIEDDTSKFTVEGTAFSGDSADEYTVTGFYNGSKVSKTIKVNVEHTWSLAYKSSVIVQVNENPAEESVVLQDETGHQVTSGVQYSIDKSSGYHSSVDFDPESRTYEVNGNSYGNDTYNLIARYDGKVITGPLNVNVLKFRIDCGVEEGKPVTMRAGETTTSKILKLFKGDGSRVTKDITWEVVDTNPSVKHSEVTITGNTYHITADTENIPKEGVEETHMFKATYQGQEVFKEITVDISLGYKIALDNAEKIEGEDAYKVSVDYNQTTTPAAIKLVDTSGATVEETTTWTIADEDQNSKVSIVNDQYSVTGNTATDSTLSKHIIQGTYKLATITTTLYVQVNHVYDVANNNTISVKYDNAEGKTSDWSLELQNEKGDVQTGVTWEVWDQGTNKWSTGIVSGVNTSLEINDDATYTVRGLSKVAGGSEDFRIRATCSIGGVQVQKESTITVEADHVYHIAGIDTTTNTISVDYNANSSIQTLELQDENNNAVSGNISWELKDNKVKGGYSTINLTNNTYTVSGDTGGGSDQFTVVANYLNEKIEWTVTVTVNHVYHVGTTTISTTVGNSKDGTFVLKDENNDDYPTQGDVEWQIQTTGVSHSSVLRTNENYTITGKSVGKDTYTCGWKFKTESSFRTFDLVATIDYSSEIAAISDVEVQKSETQSVQTNLSLLAVKAAEGGSKTTEAVTDTNNITWEIYDKESNDWKSYSHGTYSQINIGANGALTVTGTGTQDAVGSEEYRVRATYKNIPVGEQTMKVTVRQFNITGADPIESIGVNTAESGEQFPHKFVLNEGESTVDPNYVTWQVTEDTANHSDIIMNSSGNGEYRVKGNSVPGTDVHTVQATYTKDGFTHKVTTQLSVTVDESSTYYIEGGDRTVSMLMNGTTEQAFIIKDGKGDTIESTDWTATPIGSAADYVNFTGVEGNKIKFQAKNQKTAATNCQWTIKGKANDATQKEVSVTLSISVEANILMRGIDDFYIPIGLNGQYNSKSTSKAFYPIVSGSAETKTKFELYEDGGTGEALTGVSWKAEVDYDKGGSLKDETTRVKVTGATTGAYYIMSGTTVGDTYYKITGNYNGVDVVNWIHIYVYDPGTVYYKISNTDDTCTITGMNGRQSGLDDYDQKLIIPKQIGLHRVTKIGDDAFNNSSSKNNGKYFGGVDFSNAENLEEIGQKAFYYNRIDPSKCNSDSILDLTNTKLTFVGEQAFDRIHEYYSGTNSGRNRWRALKLPSTIRTLKSESFGGEKEEWYGNWTEYPAWTAIYIYNSTPNDPETGVTFEKNWVYYATDYYVSEGTAQAFHVPVGTAELYKKKDNFITGENDKKKGYITYPVLDDLP